ncbi:hypothetical protein [Kutzneria buriramensis]|uniref:Uncharacterized protein n=1 Tax=Kutzneria buriramensis TaxID=1045776 RepID=A0A3E0H0D0_9PSEU|nr:hypothetical protein [Kutzneria buriramensis]REH35772.1 hypothetical protein BCF44_117160 [Kutzneria buriramensis]
MKRSVLGGLVIAAAVAVLAVGVSGTSSVAAPDLHRSVNSYVATTYQPNAGTHIEEPALGGHH